MRIHIFRPDYGEAGFTRPCPACGHHISPETLKGWEYRYCSPKNWHRFTNRRERP